ncbi:MAG TPA: NifU family protein [Saprospiraceae bacterium]|nr:NifU family protein [Saprospiraceae bacterium]HQW57161.1 NifU family protein [Saprospiraceae bacterium]
MTELLLDRLENALDEIRPHLNVDGGDIEIVEVTPDMNLVVRWIGNCESCTMSALTMRGGVEQVIRNRVPEIASVIAINSNAVKF